MNTCRLIASLIFFLILLVLIANTVVSQNLLVEIDRIGTSKTQDAVNAFMNTWISCHPLPLKMVDDDGPDFKSNKWTFSMDDCGIEHKRITPHTPTANGVVKTTHRVMGQVMRAVLENEDPHAREEMEQCVENALAIARCAC